MVWVADAVERLYAPIVLAQPRNNHKRARPKREREADVGMKHGPSAVSLGGNLSIYMRKYMPVMYRCDVACPLQKKTAKSMPAVYSFMKGEKENNNKKTKKKKQSVVGYAGVSRTRGL